MATYVPVIGLEIHAELDTKTKMFCDCKNDPDEEHPNINVCPICLAHPGAMPTANKKAIESVIKVGMALQGDIPAVSKFDRKNYFYPDLPKAYQISQYDQPLVFGGVLKGVRLRRVHLEEDTGALTHENSKLQALNSKSDSSLVNFNRAGVPLMELVTEPDIRNADDAVAFAKELQLILRYLSVSYADMDRGQMRVEANVSLGKIHDGELVFGTKVEVKNINSFRAVHDAIEYELQRQRMVLEEGGEVKHETRGWNESSRETVSQRTKEEAHDYRYFPEPDLPPLDLSRFPLNDIKLSIPELPAQKRIRFAKEFDLSEPQADLLVSDPRLASHFEDSVSELMSEDNQNLAQEIKLLFNYLTSDLRGLMIENGIKFEELKITPENFADLVELISHNTVSSRSAKDILRSMMQTGADPHTVLKEQDLHQISDEEALLDVVRRVIETNVSAVSDFKNGKENALQFLVGKAMAELKGKGNPEVLQRMIRERT
ncbi:MAG: Asp-tRNA(Asn)/Glu-tRNA(Gln) amidotransferase subunit GatB [Candidatus Harrisonbacteria bacterium CG10_big_fil_rev_8_21_14_0_10_40_38]|uniref:Aspartyl/glutamyl-tRNA(Asn/Gln) amidotransferase subunit B n=1 Tax=Candidatus Harrisonbacteria bacterium CG10_big_fil_rev_8_21_14_0_10_40_38 TaxID=1974583 RepID=A0A2H0UT06_9BACT|nr:MAG: Asp-tRNA(Asn)/Glu-tRNA(Gln) amidotransferase subunit GatB [Candidatus Harrisonbacteria bacterium CG10_big_fil_rev_8_21_14_0_10_40_38]